MRNWLLVYVCTRLEVRTGFARHKTRTRKDKHPPTTSPRSWARNAESYNQLQYHFLLSVEQRSTYKARTWSTKAPHRGEGFLKSMTTSRCPGKKKKTLKHRSHWFILFRWLRSTVIPRYVSNRFTSFRLYEMYKLVPVFKFASQFSQIRASSSRKPIVVPVGK
jgi:hypothetical protein